MTKNKLNIFIMAICLSLVSGCQLNVRKFDGSVEKYLSNSSSFIEYADSQGGHITFKDLRLEHHDLNGMRIKSLILENCNLSNIRAKESTIGKLIIRNSDLINVEISYSSINEIILENSNLNQAIIGSKKVINSTIVNSKLVDSQIEIDSEHIRIIGSFLKDVNFSRSTSKNFKIINTKFHAHEESDFGWIHSGSLHIKNSFLNVEFQESKVKTTILENVTGHWAGFARLKGDTFVIKDSDLYALSLGGSASELKHFESSNSSFEELSFRNVKHNGKVIIKTCPKTSGFIFTKALLKKVSFENCNFDRIRFDKSIVDEIVLLNVQFYSAYARFDGKWDLMDVNTFTLDNVFIQGHFNMEDARIGKLVKINLRKSENLEINYKGANFKL